MIHDTDASLRGLLRRDVADEGDVEVVFDAPSRDWAAKRTGPTIDLFLFDIREDVNRRRVELERVVDEEGTIVGRRRPPRRFRLSYLVTAWTQRPEDEHRLLSSVVEAMLPHEELPRDVLEGRLSDQGLPVFLTVGLPPPPERSIGEIWSAMGGELKPSVEVVCSVPFVVDELRPAGPPVTEEPRFDFIAGGTTESRGANGAAAAAAASAAAGGDEGDDADGGATTPRRVGAGASVGQSAGVGAPEVVRGGEEGGGGRVITIQPIDHDDG